MAASNPSETAQAPPAAGEPPVTHAQAIAYLAGRHRFRPIEVLPWVLAIAAYFVFPDRMTFGSQVLVMVLFALSLDLILGFAGIVTLGHAAFFGVGAYTAGKYLFADLGGFIIYAIAVLILLAKPAGLYGRE